MKEMMVLPKRTATATVPMRMVLCTAASNIVKVEKTSDNGTPVAILTRVPSEATTAAAAVLAPEARGTIVVVVGLVVVVVVVVVRGRVVREAIEILGRWWRVVVVAGTVIIPELRMVIIFI